MSRGSIFRVDQGSRKLVADVVEQVECSDDKLEKMDGIEEENLVKARGGLSVYHGTSSHTKKQNTDW
jgi:hypothetical protein